MGERGQWRVGLRWDAECLGLIMPQGGSPRSRSRSASGMGAFPWSLTLRQDWTPYKQDAQVGSAGIPAGNAPKVHD